MAKKKIGTVKITRKVTVTTTRKQNYHLENRVQPAYVSAPAVSQQTTQNAINAVQRETKKLETAIKNSSRPATLPSGGYSPTVEVLYEEFEKRRKSDAVNQSAMYDVFVSHASEDKKDFVDPLVEALQDAGIRVWYDTLEMQWGKSLREQIDNGIKRSRFAILVLSKNFFAKRWPQRELDGILAKQDVTGATPLPIWHNISFEEVYDFSPTLSGVFSLSTDSNSIDDICRALKLQLEKEEIKEC